jgi:transcriptional regulator with XRE-family HTH domain
MREADLRKQVGLAIRRLRQERNISQATLAKSAQLNRTYLTGIETGRRNLTLQTMSRLAEALGVPVAEFFQGFNDP